MELASGRAGFPTSALSASLDMNVGGSVATESQPRAVYPRRFSLAAILVFSFVGLVAAAAGGVLVLSFTSAQQNTASLVQQRTDLTIQNVIGHMRLHLDQAREQTEFIAALVRQGALDVSDRERLKDIMLGSMAAVPQVSAVAFVGRDEKSLRVERGAGEVLNVTFGAEDDDTVAAMEPDLSRGSHWGRIIWSASLMRPVVNLRTPVRRSDGELLGVLISLVSVADLSVMLTEDKYGEGENAFILYGRDLVLAHGSLTEGFPALSAERSLPTLSEVGDPVLAQMWSGRLPEDNRSRYFGNGFGHLAAASGEMHLFLYDELTGYGDVPWLIGRHFRLRDINAEARRVLSTGILSLVVILATTLVALLLARAIARPVLQLAERADRVRRLEVSGVQPLPSSVIRELDTAAGAFNAMLGGLRWFESYVPKTLVRHLMEQDNASPLRSKEQVVTVLFTDIDGFSALAQTMSAAETAEMLNAHFELVVHHVETDNGTVDKYIGDAVMAFWGAPVAQPDHAERAVRAALAIATAIEDDNLSRRARGAPPLHVRLGLHTGQVIAGNIGAPGRVNYTVVGDTVNIAHRIERLGGELADRNDEVTVLLSGATAACLSEAIKTESLGGVELRGRAGLVSIYRVERASGSLVGQQSSETRRSIPGITVG